MDFDDVNWEAACAEVDKVIEASVQSSQPGFHTDANSASRVLTPASCDRKDFGPKDVYSASCKFGVTLQVISPTAVAAMFSYSPKLVDFFKSIPGRRYDPDMKSWTFALEQFAQVLNGLEALHTEQPMLINCPSPCVIQFLLQRLNESRMNHVAPPVDLSGVPTKLLSALFPFQREGVEFALRHQGRCLIADEMGLGKTLQALAAACCYVSEWPLLIICPSSVRFVWSEEIGKWVPGLRADDVNVVITAKQSIASRVTIISYDLAAKLHEVLQEIGYRVVICDESHCLKNSKAKRTTVLLPLLQKATRVLLLSGTPALSRPCELFTQVHVLAPSIIPAYFPYTIRYCRANKMAWGWDDTGSACLHELNVLLNQSVMIRRLKRDVLSQLPSKIRQAITVPVSSAFAKSLGVSRERNRALELAAASGNAGADKARQSLLIEMYADTGAAKVPAIAEFINDVVIESTEKYLIFAHHKIVLDGIEAAVRKAKLRFVRIDGATAPTQRPLLVERFQQDEGCRVAVLSITAAGTGLTLTAASVVVFAELFWTPGVLSQCENRAHRIGQANAVTIKYLLAKGSVDDIIWPMINRKLQLIGEALNGQEELLETAHLDHGRALGQLSLQQFFKPVFGTESTQEPMKAPVAAPVINIYDDEEETQHVYRDLFPGQQVVQKMAGQQLPLVNVQRTSKSAVQKRRRDQAIAASDAFAAVDAFDEAIDYPVSQRKR